MSTAVVTIARGRHDHLAAQHLSLLAGETLPDVYVVVAMDDPEIMAWAPQGVLAPHLVPVPVSDTGLPLAAARNAGAAAAFARGAETVVGLDVDCLAGPGLVSGYTASVLARPDVVWSGPVTYLPPVDAGYDLARLEDLDAPHPARPDPGPGRRVVGGDPDLFWSLSYALHRDTWRRVGGFCEEYVGYGAEDTDFGRQVVARGSDLGWTGSARAYHQHHPTRSPPVDHLVDILRNGEIFYRRWGRWPMQGWLGAFEELGLVVRSGDGWVAAG